MAVAALFSLSSPLSPLSTYSITRLSLSLSLSGAACRLVMIYRCAYVCLANTQVKSQINYFYERYIGAVHSMDIDIACRIVH